MNILNDPSMKEIVEEFKKNLPEYARRDGYISKREMQEFYDVRSRHGRDEYFERKHEVAKMAPGGFDRNERWHIRQTDRIRETLKNLFGFGKK